MNNRSVTDTHRHKRYRSTGLFLAGIAILLFLMPAIVSAGTITATTSFTPAQAGRTWMDVGGVWNGAANVTATTGDTFSLTLSNAGTISYDMLVLVNLPVNFNYVPGTAAVSGNASCTTVPTVAASQVADILNFNLGPVVGLVGYDMPVGCALTFTYGLTVAAPKTDGTYLVIPSWQGATADGVPRNLSPIQPSGTTTQSVLIQNGATIITKNQNPAGVPKTVGDPVNWDVVVVNTGLGGLFNVDIDESAINPGAALTLTGMAVTAPALPVASSPAAAIRRLPYLAPGVSYVATVNSTVTACTNIDNTVTTTDITGGTTKNTSGHVALDLKEPAVTATIPAVTVPYSGTAAVTIPVQNTGAGPAASITLESDFPSRNLTVSGVGAGWSYNAGSGLFTYSAGNLASGATSNLTFNLAATNICTFSSQTIQWTTNFKNVCNTTNYAVPTQFSTVNAPATAPTVTLNKTTPSNRVVAGQSSSYTITLNATNKGNITTDPFSVTDTLPAGITGISLTVPGGTSTTCSGSCSGGDTITWSVPQATALPVNLVVNFTVPLTSPCLGGTIISNSASVSATSTQSCSLSTTSPTASILLQNNPVGFVTQLFDVTAASFETGNHDAGTLGIRDAGEGAFIPFYASYTFSGAPTPYAGTWAGSTYYDNFGTLPDMNLNSGLLTVSLDGAGAIPFPNANANITCGSGTVAGNNCKGGITIKLDDLAGAGYFNDANVAGHTLRIDYSTTASDQDLPLPGVTRAVTELVTLQVFNGGAGGCGPVNPTYTQGAFYSISRAVPAPTLSAFHLDATPAPIIDVCEPLNFTLNVGNGTAYNPSNILATILNNASNYNYVDPPTPTYGGLFNAGNIIYTPNAGVNPTFALNPASTTLSASGAITFRGNRKASSGVSPTSLSARIDYDDSQYNSSGARDFSPTGVAPGVTASWTPMFVRSGNITVLATPQNFTITSNKATWDVYVTNGGNGVAYNAQLSNTVGNTLAPYGMSPNTTATDAANAATTCLPNLNCNVSVAGQVMNWNLGDIPPGATKKISVVVDVTGGICTIAMPANSIVARWGCGGVWQQTQTSNSPSFTLPSGQMQVVHDSTASVCKLCENGTDQIVVRNTGSAHIYNTTASEVLNPATTGIDIISGTVEYQTVGSSGISLWIAGGNPSGAGTGASPYQWTSAQIPPLADLAPVGESGIYEVRIRFSLSSSNLTSSAFPVLTASAAGSIACGTAVSSPGTPFSIPVQKPDITVTKTGINRTVVGGAVGSGVFTDTTYAGNGDIVEWKVSVQNTNAVVPTHYTRFADIFTANNATLRQLVQNDNGDVNGVISSNSGFLINPIPPSTTRTFYIQETVGNACIASNNTADVTWGCTAAVDAQGRNALINPPSVAAKNLDPSGLNMTPAFGTFVAGVPATQTITSLPGGRASIDVRVTNSGGTATGLTLTDTFPAGMQLDASVAPVFIAGSTGVEPAAGGTCPVTVPAACITGVTTGGTATVPIFTLNGSLRNGATAILRYYVLPTVYDTTAATTFPALVTNEPNPALDPNPPATANNRVDLSYINSCSGLPSTLTNLTSINLLTPDLDIVTLGTPNQVVNSAVVNFTFTIRNNGDALSVADQITFQLQNTLPGPPLLLGGGWTVNFVRVTTPGTGGILNANCAQIGGVYTCTPAQIGTLRSGLIQQAIVTVNVTPLDNGLPLTMPGMVTGALFNQSNVATGNNYSLDQARYRVIGFNTSKVQQATSEATTINPDVAIGEEVTYRLRARWFGGIPGENLTLVTVRDTTYDPGPTAPGRFGYVSSAPTGSNTVTINSTTPTFLAGATPVRGARVDFGIADISTGSGTFEVDMITRVMNNALNTSGSLLPNNLGESFTYLGQIFRSNSVNDGFAGGTAFAALHAVPAAQPRVQRPIVTVDKQVRNVTTGSPFGKGGGGNGSDIFEFRVVLANTGTAPAFDLSLVDNLHAKLVMIDGAADAVDNDGDLTTDGGDLEGTYVTGAGGSVIFNEANTVMPTAGRKFTQLNTGQSITLLFRATGDVLTLVGGEILPNTATVTYSTLLGLSGGQTAPIGTAGAADGEAILSASDTININISRVSGYVYNDLNHNGTHEGAEGYTGLPVIAGPLATLHVKLIANAALPGGPATAVATVNPVTGEYSFGTVAPGDYTVIVDDNINLADVTPYIPPNWFGTETPTQSRSFSLPLGGAATQLNFGFYQGIKVSGVVFNDNGVGCGVPGPPPTCANNGIQDGTEQGIAKVTVKATDGGVTTYDTTVTDATGSYTLWLPSTATTTEIVETNLGNYISISGSAGTTAGGPGGIYTRTTDRTSFTASAGSTYSGVNFADVLGSEFLTDGSQSGLAGAVLYYPHTFTPHSGGSVLFTTTAVASPAVSGWNEIILQDTNCNGIIDAAEPQITAAINVSSGQTICILIKEFIPGGAPTGAENKVTVTAAFTYTNAPAPVPVSSMTHTDVTTVGAVKGAGLTLVKSVDKASALPGDTLIYTITYSNSGIGPLSNIVINDTVPIYTTLVTNCCVNPTTVCLGTPVTPWPQNITACAPASTVPAVSWTLTGTLAPGNTGQVKFSVQIQP